MNTESINPQSQPESAEAFYCGALDRIRNFMIAIALGFSAAAWWRFGRWSALGFLLGFLIVLWGLGAQASALWRGVRRNTVAVG